MACIDAGWTPAAAKPDVRGRPYLSRNPPAVLGSPKTGRPAIMSRMKRSSVLSFRFLMPSESSPFFCREAKVEMKSQPGTFSLSVCFWIFDAFRQRPSPITSITPPRIRFRGVLFGSTMLRTSGKPAHSISSVSSPFTMIGQALTIISISSGGGLYCNPPRYSPNSSLTRSTSGMDGSYFSKLSALRIMSAINTARACAVPPAARMGPQKSIETKRVPSKLFMTRTCPMPSSGATRTASVSTARPTRNPVSMLF